MESPHTEIDRQLDLLERSVEKLEADFAWGFVSGAVSAAIIGIVAALILFGPAFAHDADVIAKIEQDAHQEKRKTSIGIPMPMDCDFTMKVSVAGIIERESCWNRETSARKWDAP